MSSGKSAGQLAYEARQAAKGRRMGANDDWTDSQIIAVIALSWDELPAGMQADEEAAAAAVETEQLREIRADRDQLKKRILDLAAAWKDEAADDLARVRPAPGGSVRAGVLNQCAGQICKGLDV